MGVRFAMPVRHQQTDVGFSFNCLQIRPITPPFDSKHLFFTCGLDLCSGRSERSPHLKWPAPRWEMVLSIHQHLKLFGSSKPKNVGGDFHNFINWFSVFFQFKITFINKNIIMCSYKRLLKSPLSAEVFFLNWWGAEILFSFLPHSRPWIFHSRPLASPHRQPKAWKSLQLCRLQTHYWINLL